MSSLGREGYLFFCSSRSGSPSVRRPAGPQGPAGRGSFAIPSSQIELLLKSFTVQARHRRFQLRQPLCEANIYSSWVKMLGPVRGRPLALKLLIQKTTVRWLLGWRPASLAAHRARLLTVVATLA